MRKNTEQHAKIAELRSLGMSLRSIAEACGLSIPRVHQILNPYNAEGAFIDYNCSKCENQWTSKSKTKPKRCPECGTHFWTKNSTFARGLAKSLEHTSVSVIEEDFTPTAVKEDSKDKESF